MSQNGTKDPINLLQRHSQRVTPRRGKNSSLVSLLNSNRSPKLVEVDDDDDDVTIEGKDILELSPVSVKSHTSIKSPVRKNTIQKSPVRKSVINKSPVKSTVKSPVRNTKDKSNISMNRSSTNTPRNTHKSPIRSTGKSSTPITSINRSNSVLNNDEFLSEDNLTPKNSYQLSPIITSTIISKSNERTNSFSVLNETAKSKPDTKSKSMSNSNLFSLSNSNPKPHSFTNSNQQSNSFKNESAKANSKPIEIIDDINDHITKTPKRNHDLDVQDTIKKLTNFIELQKLKFNELQRGNDYERKRMSDNEPRRVSDIERQRMSNERHQRVSDLQRDNSRIISSDRKRQRDNDSEGQLISEERHQRVSDHIIDDLNLRDNDKQDSDIHKDDLNLLEKRKRDDSKYKIEYENHGRNFDRDDLIDIGNKRKKLNNYQANRISSETEIYKLKSPNEDISKNNFQQREAKLTQNERDLDMVKRNISISKPTLDEDLIYNSYRDKENEYESRRLRRPYQSDIDRVKFIEKRQHERELEFNSIEQKRRDQERLNIIEQRQNVNPIETHNQFNWSVKQWNDLLKFCNDYKNCQDSIKREKMISITNINEKFGINLKQLNFKIKCINEFNKRFIK